METTYGELGVIAKTLDALEQARMETKQRIYILTKPADEADEDGICRGFGLPEEAPSVQQLYGIYDGLEVQEKACVKALEKAMKRHPLGEFVAEAKGLGFKTASRLLAAIHDPYWHGGEDRPRRVSELWSYCGMDVRQGSAPKHRRGEVSNWNAEARKRLYVITDGFIKQGAGGPYRELYDEYKATYVEVEVDGKVLYSRGDWDVPVTKGHVDNRARRRMSKLLLKNLWLASRDVHVERGSVVL